MLHPPRVERRAPAALVVLGQLEIEALACIPTTTWPDAGPGVEPGTQRPERAVVRQHRAPSESHCRTEELAALVGHALLDDPVCLE